MKKFLIQPIGRYLIQQGTHFISYLGKICILVANTVIIKPPFYGYQWLNQWLQWGVGCILIVTITSAFTGMVLTLQTYHNFVSWGGQYETPFLVVFALVRELAPVLTGLMVAGRAGSSLAAQLTSMKISGQFDVLTIMNIPLRSYILTPSFWMACLMMPLLIGISSVTGLISSYGLWVLYLQENSHIFLIKLSQAWTQSLWLYGWLKGFFFGALINLTAQIYGCLMRSFSIDDLRRNTTLAVVTASALILVINYFLSACFFTS